MSDFAEFKGSAVWEHYLRSQDGHTAKCRLCKKVLKISGGSTKGLHVHGGREVIRNQCTNVIRIRHKERIGKFTYLRKDRHGSAVLQLAEGHSSYER